MFVPLSSTLHGKPEAVIAARSVALVTTAAFGTHSKTVAHVGLGHEPAINTNPPTSVAVPAGVVTRTSFAPALPIGDTAVIDVAEATTKLVAAIPPIFTLVAPVKFLPTIVIAVPPAAEPKLGLTDEMESPAFAHAPQSVSTCARSTPLTNPSPLLSPPQLPCACTDEVETPNVIVTAATIESRMFGDFIFGLLKFEQPENLERIQDNPKQRKVQENPRRFRIMAMVDAMKIDSAITH